MNYILQALALILFLGAAWILGMPAANAADVFKYAAACDLKSEIKGADDTIEFGITWTGDQDMRKFEDVFIFGNNGKSDPETVFGLRLTDYMVIDQHWSGRPQKEKANLHTHLVIMLPDKFPLDHKFKAQQSRVLYMPIGDGIRVTSYYEGTCEIGRSLIKD